MNSTVRPQFKIDGKATILHLNVRKEGHEDDKIIAVDIKIDIQRIDRRLCAWFDEALESFLWRGDTESLVARNVYLDAVRYQNEIQGATVVLNGKAFSGCRISKFKIDPRDGGVMNIGCSVTAYPTSTALADIANNVLEDVNCVIEGPRDLYDDDIPF